MKKLIFLLSFFTLLSCHSKKEEAEPTAFEAALAIVPDAESQPDRPHAAEDFQLKDPRKLLKQGTVEFEAEDIEKTKKQIRQAVSRAGGYVSLDADDNSDDRLKCTMKVRVPVSRFDGFLEDATKGVTKFDERTVTVEDVTEEFFAVEARLKTKKEIEARYLSLLSKSNSVKDILGVEKELGEIRTDIEATEGRLKYLSSQVQFSTLDITFYKTLFQTAGPVAKIRLAILAGWTNVFDFFLLLVNVWPFLLLITAGFWLFRKVYKSRVDVTEV